VNLSAIRIKCAELVGWTEIRQGTSDLIGTSTDGRIAWQLPNYPESDADALQLVEWMSKPENGGWDTQCSQWSRSKGWRVTFAKGEGKTYVGFIGTADTFALAICLAFLKANNIEPETLQ